MLFFRSSSSVKLLLRLLPAAALPAVLALHVGSHAAAEAPTKKEAQFRALALAADGSRREAQSLLSTLDQTLGEVEAERGLSPLITATENSDTDTVRWCLESACDVTRAPDVLHKAMEEAVDPEITRLLLAYGADPNAISALDLTPLQVVSDVFLLSSDKPRQMPQLLAKATSLLDAGADPNKAKDNLGRRPLYYALKRKYTDLASLLLQRGASPDVVASFKYDKNLSAMDVLRQAGDTATAAAVAAYL